MKLVSFVILIIFCTDQLNMQYIDDPIVFSGDFDPSPQGLPNDWVNKFVQNTKPPDHTSFIPIQKLKNKVKFEYCKEPNLLMLLMELFSKKEDQVEVEDDELEGAIRLENNRLNISKSKDVYMRPPHENAKRHATQSMDKEFEEMISDRNRSMQKTSKNVLRDHLAALQEAYEKDAYVSVDNRKELAKSTGLTDTQIKSWFKKKRKEHSDEKDKKESENGKKKRN